MLRPRRSEKTKLYTLRSRHYRTTAILKTTRLGDSPMTISPVVVVCMIGQKEHAKGVFLQRGPAGIDPEFTQASLSTLVVYPHKPRPTPSPPHPP